MARPVGSGRIDLSGVEINQFVVVRRAEDKVRLGVRYSRWECLCSCGNMFVTEAQHIRRKKSCGCHKLNSMFRRKHAGSMTNVHHALHQYKTSAKKRGYEWCLDEDVAIKLLHGDCVYCGAPPCRRWAAYKYCDAALINGIDRSDNRIGYTQANSLSCCMVCNRAKSAMDRAAFEVWLNRVAAFRSKPCQG